MNEPIYLGKAYRQGLPKCVMDMLFSTLNTYMYHVGGTCSSQAKHTLSPHPIPTPIAAPPANS